MGCEIDVMAVGGESQSGDAIALRFGNLTGTAEEQAVVVIDGGFQDSGEKLVDHIRRYYHTNRVDLVISTHPDGDHVSGLRIVLDQLEVSKLWMHCPWDRTGGMAALFSDGRITDSSLGDRLEDALNVAKEVEKMAEEQGIPIEEPFAGRTFGDDDGWIGVIGPTHEFYEACIQEMLEERDGSKSEGILQRGVKKVGDVISRVAESWHMETLTDTGETSPLNNTSTILLFEHGEEKVLFTADAGMPALTGAMDLLDRTSINTADLTRVQVPHHGSKRNVGPTVLDRLLGERREEGEVVREAFVSAAKEGNPKHPARKVVNAFHRRGAKVYSTQGNSLRMAHDVPPREGWTSATPLPFYEKVQE